MEGCGTTHSHLESNGQLYSYFVFPASTLPLYFSPSSELTRRDIRNFFERRPCKVLIVTLQYDARIEFNLILPQRKQRMDMLSLHMHQQHA
jgi:hypothetical protein